MRSRSVRLGNVPENTQEGLLQQKLEKEHKVKRLEIFYDKREAVVEFENAAVRKCHLSLLKPVSSNDQAAGQLLLNSEPLMFQGETLTVRQEGQDAPKGRPGLRASGPAVPVQMFAPRMTGRPKAGLGKPRTVPNPGSVSTKVNPNEDSRSGGSAEKGQDDFRKLLG